MFKPLKDDERWAAACVQDTLPGVTVGQHDDNSRESVHDLDLSLGGLPTFGAVEVTAAIDPRAIAGWKRLPGGGDRLTMPGLVGGWYIVVRRDARRKEQLQEKLPDLLRALERDGRTRPDRAVLDELDALGVEAWP